MSSSLPDYYKTLQIRPTASPEVIEAVYRQLARIYHPDRNVGKDTTSQMQSINVAYSILRDPYKRREYDRLIAGDLFTKKIDLSILRWVNIQWATMGWDARIISICVILSIVCLLGIARNLLQRQVMASTHAAVNATVVAIQMDQAIVATVAAITEDAAEKSTISSNFTQSSVQSPLDSQHPGTESEPEQTASERSSEISLHSSSETNEHVDRKLSLPSSDLFRYSALIDAAQGNVRTWVNNLANLSRTTLGLIQIQTHPYYNRVDLLPHEKPSPPLGAGVSNTN